MRGGAAMKRSVIRALAAGALFAAFPVAGQETEVGEQPEYRTGLTAADQKLEIDIAGKTAVIDYVIAPDGDAVFEGDIILGPAEELEPLRQQTMDLMSVDDYDFFGLFKRGDFKWPKGYAAYWIAPDLANPGRVTQAIAHWEIKTKIRFNKLASPSGDHIQFVAAGPDVCSSSVGRVGGGQKVKLGANCSFGNVVHEIGHALGIGHEQMREDRDQRVTVNIQNVKSGYESNFTKKPLIYRDEGEYCYGSIMHYSAYAFTKNNLPTIVPPDNISIGQRVALAACDIKTVADSYASEYAKR